MREDLTDTTMDCKNLQNLDIVKQIALDNILMIDLTFGTKLDDNQMTDHQFS